MLEVIDGGRGWGGVGWGGMTEEEEGSGMKLVGLVSHMAFNISPHVLFIYFLLNTGLVNLIYYLLQQC